MLSAKMAAILLGLNVLNLHEAKTKINLETDPANE